MKQAACMLIIDPNSQLLRVVTRRDNPNRLCMPGGKVDPGENFIQAAIRETWEETGLKVDPSNTQLIFEDVCPGDVDYYCQTFLVYDTSPITNGLEEDITTKQVTWQEFLNSCAFKDYNQNIYELYRKISTSDSTRIASSI